MRVQCNRPSLSIVLILVALNLQDLDAQAVRRSVRRKPVAAPPVFHKGVDLLFQSMRFAFIAWPMQIATLGIELQLSITGGKLPDPSRSVAAQAQCPDSEAAYAKPLIQG